MGDGGDVEESVEARVRSSRRHGRADAVLVVGTDDGERGAGTSCTDGFDRDDFRLRRVADDKFPLSFD
jgi:hypothetical protein